MAKASGWVDAATVVAALFAYSLMETMIAPVLPQIQKALHASTAELGGIFIYFLLVGALATPIVGRLGDLHDKRRVMLGVLAVAGVGVLLAVTATSVHQLALGQALQGVGLGLAPLAVGLMGEVLPRERVALGNGLLIGAGTLSTSLGLVLAGPLTEALGYRAIFWLPSGVLLACALLLLARLRAGPARLPQAVGAKAGVDWGGAALLALGLVSLLLGLAFGAEAGWSHPMVRVLLPAAAVLLAVWVWFERRHAAPLLDVRLFGHRAVALTSVIAFAVGFGSIGTYVLVPLLLQADPATGIGFSSTATETGWCLLPLGIGGSITAALVGPLERASAPRLVMLLGAVLLTAGAALPLALHGQPWHLGLSMLLVGGGVGFLLTEAMNTVVRSVAAERAASVSSAVFVIRSLGGSVGALFSTGLLGAAQHAAQPGAAAGGFMLAFGVAAGVSAVGIVAAVCFPVQRV